MAAGNTRINNLLPTSSTALILEVVIISILTGMNSAMMSAAHFTSMLVKSLEENTN